MRWNDNGIDKPKVFDSKYLSEDTQKIRIDKIQEQLKQEEDYNEEFKAYEEYLLERKKRFKKVFLFAIIVVISVAFIVSFIAVKKISKITSLEKEAEEFIKNKQLEKAAETYKLLYDETEEPSYLQNFRDISKKIENVNFLKEADNNIKLKDYEGAIELLLTITTDDEKMAEVINEKINFVAKKWLLEIENIYENKDYNKCTSEINKFVNLLPDNIGGVDFRNKISKRKIGVNSKFKNSLAKDRKELDNLNSKVSRKIYEKSKSIVGTEQHVAVDNANVRLKPTKESKITGIVHKGDSIYIEDTFVEGRNSIWCKINYYSENKQYTSGWISYNIINGTEYDEK